MRTKINLAVGTPMYGGMNTAPFCKSVTELALALRSSGDEFTPIYLGNESLIPRARNTIVWHFLQTDATHLLFCDADTGFRWQDVSRMVAAAKPILVGPCPLKRINWESVAAAVKAGVSASELHRYTGIFNVVPLEGNYQGSAGEPFEIKWGGTGFMLIERHVFERLAPGTPEYVNRNPGDAMPAGAKVKHYFPVDIMDDDLLSEDYSFCKNWRRAGGKVWAAPWCELVHLGTYAFSGVFKDSFAVPSTERTHATV